MKIYKTLFWLTLICGLSILVIGVILQMTNKTSEGYVSGRFGDVYHGVINGYSAIFLGILILLLSLWTFKIHKDEKKKFDEME